jgi:hypothetical protein
MPPAGEPRRRAAWFSTLISFYRKPGVAFNAKNPAPLYWRQRATCPDSAAKQIPSPASAAVQAACNGLYFSIDTPNKKKYLKK